MGRWMVQSYMCVYSRSHHAPLLTAAAQTLCLRVDLDAHLDLGPRFYHYARRVRVLNLRRSSPVGSNSERFVAPAVILAWAHNMLRQSIFPRLKRVTASFEYCRDVPGCRMVLKFLTPHLRELSLACHKDLLLTKEEHAKLRSSAPGLTIVTISKLKGDQTAARQLSSTLITASTHLQNVSVPLPIGQRELRHLSTCSQLTRLHVEIAGPPLQNLPPGCFPALEVLEVTEGSAEMTALQFCLMLRQNNRLRTFSYDSRAISLDRTVLRTLVQHMTQWITLKGLLLRISTAQDPLSLADYRILHEQLHTLSALESFTWSTDAQVFLDADILYHLVAACSSLRFWTFTSSHRTWGQDYIELPLPEFLDILVQFPRVERLPVRILCDELPDLDDLENIGGSNYNTMLHVKTVHDPVAVSEVFRIGLPRVIDCLAVDPPGFDPLDEPEGKNIAELSRLIREHRKACEVDWSTLDL
jgi:hypothetical protein